MKQYNEKTQWIVKSSSQILGPYSTKQVYNLIEKKSIIPIDEIIPENGYWAYVRDVSVFQNALDKQAQIAGVEVTKTQNLTSTFTDDMTSTALLDDTEELSRIEAVDHTQPNPKIEPLQSSSLPKPSIEDFLDGKPKAKKKKFPVFKLMFLTSIIVGIAGYYNQASIQRFKGSFYSANTIKMVQQNIVEGDYKTAYLMFQDLNQADGIKANMPGFYVQFAALVLNQERQTVYARDLLEKSKASIKQTPEWLTAMGLSYLIDQNYSESFKFLNKSLSVNPEFLPAWVNLGHLYLNQNKFQEAWDFFYSAYLRGHSEGHIPVFMSLALIEQWKVNGDKRLLQKAKELISNFLSTSADQRYLNQILRIWLKIKTTGSNSEALNDDILSFIQSDPYISNLFKRNIYEYAFDSKRFENFCSEINKFLPSNQLNALLFKSLCYHQLGFMGQVTEAPIQAAERSFSKETLVFAIKSVILDNADEAYQKSLLIGRALSSDSASAYVLPLILQARFCEQKNDLNCSAKYWNLVFERNKLEIGAYVGLARYSGSKGEKQAVRNWISNGLLLAPSYMPLIKLSE